MALLETLTDEFDGTTLNAAKWTNTSSNGGVVTIGGGLATFTTDLTTSSRARIDSGNYTLTNSSVIIKVGALDPNATFYFIVTNGGGASGNLQLYYRGSLGQMWLTAANSTGTGAYTASSIGAYTAAAWKYIRLRFAANSACTVDRSADGITWTAVATTAALNYTLGYLRLFGQTSGVASSSTIESVNPAAAYTGTATPTGVTDTDDTGLPDLAFTIDATPDGITDPDTTSGPDLAAPPHPTSITDPETVTGPAATYHTTTDPAGTTDPDSVGNPTAGYTTTVNPAGIADTETLGDPTVPSSTIAEPAGITDPATLGEPTIGGTPLPASIVDNLAIGTPTVRFVPSHVYPNDTGDIGSIGEPTVELELFYSGAYGQGPYGGGTYSGMWIGPDTSDDPETLDRPQVDTIPRILAGELIDAEHLGQPVIGGDAVGTDVRPLSIIDGELLDAGTTTQTATKLYGSGLYGQGIYSGGQEGAVDDTPDQAPPVTNRDYGAGVYSEGLYVGLAGTITDDNPSDNPTYGTGTYNYGIYYGQAVTVPDAVPLFTNIAGQFQPALHILGIGPWSPTVEWRGAANYGLPKGSRVARPAMALPATTSKGFTLRLNDGSEARCELSQPRGSSIVFDEMDTDLWWRRKDPRTKKLEVIGRFNTAHVNLSTSDTGVNCSLQFESYETVLAARLVLKYLHPNTKPNPESMWPKGTKVTDILAFALPTNTRLDLSEATGPTPYNLGKITDPYTLAPGTTIGDVLDNLNVLSPIRWEWWIENPLDVDAAPKLRFQLGTRGTDNGVVLHDLGKGPSPIASWVRNSASDNYANSLMYTGVDGSVVQANDEAITQYGQRDTTASNSTLDGTEIIQLRAAAKRKLEQLSNRQPTYTINLAQGFWRGRNHIDVGDTVTLLIRLGKERIHEKYRVTEIAVDIDDVGLEDVTLTLGTPLASADGRSKRSPLLRLVRHLKQYVTPAGSVDIPSSADE